VLSANTFRLIILLLFFSIRITGQTVDSVSTHSVKKATIYSAVIPGAGQVYNHLAMPKGKKKAFWKVPLIYAGLAGTGYLFMQNNQLRKAYRAEYDYRETNNVASNYFQYDQSGLLTLHNEARSQRDLFIAAFGLVYLLNVVDAGIEAHFVSFDVSENLTVSFQPSYGTSQGIGFSTILKFR
jgi:hypothetical protein